MGTDLCQWIAHGFPGCEPAFPVDEKARAVDQGFVIVEPDEVKTKARPSTGRRVWPYTAVVLVAGLRYALRKPRRRACGCKCRRCYSSWGFSAASAGCCPGRRCRLDSPGLRAWGFPSKR